MTNPVGGTNRLGDLVAEGVSPWWDGVDRRRLDDGWFASLVGTDGVRGAVTDPAMLVDSLHDVRMHDDLLARMAGRHSDVESAVVELGLHDARTACDVLRDVFSDTGGQDGYVSVDLPARTAHDADAAVASSLRTVAQLARPNVMVKIPATGDGIAAMRACLSMGIGVHATEVYSRRRYRRVVGAWFDGLESAAAAGHRTATIPSVVAVPVGRIDAEIDAELESRGGDVPGARHGRPAVPGILPGDAGLAVARLLHDDRDLLLGTGRWQVLRAGGARPQRLVWSTSGTGSGAAYAGRIVGWGTVTTLSGEALDVLAGHHELSGDTLLGGRDSALAVLENLRGLGVDLPAVVRRLEHDGVARTGRHWEELSAAVRARLIDPAV